MFVRHVTLVNGRTTIPTVALFVQLAREGVACHHAVMKHIVVQNVQLQVHTRPKIPSVVHLVPLANTMTTRTPPLRVSHALRDGHNQSQDKQVVSLVANQVKKIGPITA